MLSADDARTLLDLIDVSKNAGLRDRALIGVMVYSFARIGAALKMNVGDYFQNGKRGRSAARILREFNCVINCDVNGNTVF